MINLKTMDDASRRKARWRVGEDSIMTHETELPYSIVFIPLKIRREGIMIDYGVSLNIKFQTLNCDGGFVLSKFLRDSVVLIYYFVLKIYKYVACLVVTPVHLIALPHAFIAL